MKLDELKAMSVADLRKELTQVMREQFNIRMQKVMGTVKKNHQFKQTRRTIAQINTLLTQKEAATND